jgi:hypothetical protein
MNKMFQKGSPLENGLCNILFVQNQREERKTIPQSIYVKFERYLRLSLLITQIYIQEHIFIVYNARKVDRAAEERLLYKRVRPEASLLYC